MNKASFRVRNLVVHCRCPLFLAIVALSSSIPSLCQTEPGNAMAPNARPTIHLILRLEKRKYLLGESIRFWIGVEGKRASVIPAELRKKPCSLAITRPDKNKQLEAVGWPIDGPVNTGWLGGAGLNADSTGSYSLVFKCAGEQTLPVELIVETNDITQQITTAFHFEKSGEIQMGTSIPVTFSVTNGSPYTIQFPQRGITTEGVFMSVDRQEPAYHSQLFYPWEKLSQSNTSFDTYTWDAAQQLPSITLRPGDHFQQRLLLEDAFKFDQPGKYTVSFSTVVPTLVGDKNGPFADLCPIRLTAQTKEAFTVSNAKP